MGVGDGRHMTENALHLRGGLSTFRLRHPEVSAHVEPWAVGLIRPGLRAQPEDVPIEVLDLHLVSPRIVGRRMSNPGSFAAILLEERFRVLDADPYPGPGISLVVLTKEDAAAVARD